MVAAGLITAAMAATFPALAQQGRSANPNQPAPSGPPPADRPLVPAHIQPTLSFEGGAGVLGYISGTAAVGPAWNARVTASINERFAVEGNYTGSVNRRSDQSGSLVYTAVDADLRYNLLHADQFPVQPYLAGGIGYVGYAGPGGDGAAVSIPVAVGAERLITEHIKAGARFNLRPAFFDDLSHRDQPANTAATGGSVWSLLANVGGAF
jgi:hypothetical protein